MQGKHVSRVAMVQDRKRAAVPQVQAEADNDPRKAWEDEGR
jgi:hypothetical protein